MILSQWLLENPSLVLSLHVSPPSPPKIPTEPTLPPALGYTHTGINTGRSLMPTLSVTVEWWHEAAPPGYTRSDAIRSCPRGGGCGGIISLCATTTLGTPLTGVGSLKLNEGTEKNEM